MNALVVVNQTVARENGYLCLKNTRWHRSTRLRCSCVFSQVDKHRGRLLSLVNGDEPCGAQVSTTRMIIASQHACMKASACSLLRTAAVRTFMQDCIGVISSVYSSSECVHALLRWPGLLGVRQ